MSKMKIYLETSFIFRKSFTLAQADFTCGPFYGSLYWWASYISAEFQHVFF